MTLDSSTVSSFALPQDSGGILIPVDPATVVDNVWIFEIGDTKYRQHSDGPYRAAWAITGSAGDQTSRLQAVFNDAAVSEVVFDDGDVIVNGTLTIPTGKKITFLGSGRIITTDGGGAINGGVYKFKRDEFFGAGITATEELIYTTGGSSAEEFSLP